MTSRHLLNRFTIFSSSHSTSITARAFSFSKLCFMLSTFRMIELILASSLISAAEGEQGQGYSQFEQSKGRLQTEARNLPVWTLHDVYFVRIL